MTLYTADLLVRVRRVLPQYVGTAPTDTVSYAYGVNAAEQQPYTEIADELGKKTRNYFDVFGNQVQTLLGYGAAEQTTTHLAYDVLGRRTQVTDPCGLNTTYTLDTRGLLTSKTSPDAGTVSSKDDQAGNLRYSQDANQAAAEQVFFTTYDFANRPLVSGQASATFSALDPFSSASFETTTSNWLVVRAYDARPSTTAFPWSLFSTQIGALALTHVSGRLAAVASKSNGSWQVTLFSYDADGRVVKRYQYTHANGTTTVLAALNTMDTLTLARGGHPPRAHRGRQHVVPVGRLQRAGPVVEGVRLHWRHQAGQPGRDVHLPAERAGGEPAVCWGCVRAAPLYDSRAVGEDLALPELVSEGVETSRRR